MPIKFAVNSLTNGLVYILSFQSNDLALPSCSQLRLKLEHVKRVLYNSHISDSILRCGVQPSHDGRLMHGTSAHARFDAPDLDARS